MLPGVERWVIVVGGILSIIDAGYYHARINEVRTLPGPKIMTLHGTAEWKATNVF